MISCKNSVRERKRGRFISFPPLFFGFNPQGITILSTEFWSSQGDQICYNLLNWIARHQCYYFCHSHLFNPLEFFRFPPFSGCTARNLAKSQLNMWVLWMHLLEGCDALRSTHMLPESLERPLSLNNTAPKTWRSSKYFYKYFKIISLNDVKRQKTLRGWEKLVTFLRHETLRELTTVLITTVATSLPLVSYAYRFTSF